MIIIGCDFHTRYQEIAWLDMDTGEIHERRLEHAGDQVRKFYAALPGPLRVGIEATGYSQWFERMLGELGHEFWIGDAALLRASRVRKQKTDRRDAAHILDLLRTNRFPRIWVPTPAERDLRQWVLHRVKLVQMRTKGAEPVAGHGHGPGRVPEEEAVERPGPRRTGEPAAGSLGATEASGVAATSGSTGWVDPRAARRGGTTSASASGSGSLDDASGRCSGGFGIGTLSGRLASLHRRGVCSKNHGTRNGIE